MTIDQYAITSLSYVKTALGITGVDDDALLERLINAATWKIETFCDRKFKTRTYREWHDWHGGEYLQLRNFPVTSVRRIGFGESQAFTVQGTTTSDLRVTVEVQDDRMVLSRFASSGTETASELPFATSATASALVTAINLLSGWSASLKNNTVSLDLHRLGGSDAKGVNVSVTWPDQSSAITRLQEQAGIVWFDCYGLAAWSGTCSRNMNLLVEYTAGYTQILMPYDVEQVCIELVQEMHSGGDADPLLKSESLGDYAYARADAVELTEHMRVRLAAHKRRMS